MNTKHATAKYAMTLTLALSLPLIGCSSPSNPGGQTRGPTPKATVLALETALTAADRLAISYIRQPKCTSASTNRVVCSDSTLVPQIKAAAQKAHDAVVNAQGVVDSSPNSTEAEAAVSSATAALMALQAIIPNQP